MHIVTLIWAIVVVIAFLGIVVWIAWLLARDMVQNGWPAAVTIVSGLVFGWLASQTIPAGADKVRAIALVTGFALTIAHLMLRQDNKRPWGIACCCATSPLIAAIFWRHQELGRAGLMALVWLTVVGLVAYGFDHRHAIHHFFIKHPPWFDGWHGPVHYNLEK